MRGMPPIKIVVATLLILGTVGWLSYSGVQQTKEYYVTIGELNALGGKAYTRHLRVAGNVAPGSIQRTGPNAQFVLLEQGHTFKDDAQALAVGTYGRDGVFHATQLQAKCASKYAPAKPGEAPTGNTAMLTPAK
jgi:cytochrome c-type biogenesis protein CcmE